MALPGGKDVLVVGNTYVINIYGENRFITVEEHAAIKLRALNPNNSNQRFECTLTDKNWLGFRSAATGKYLGRDSFKNLGCVATSQSESESFVMRQAERGGSAFFVQSDGRFFRTFETSDNNGLFLRTDTGHHAAVVGFTKV